MQSIGLSTALGAFIAGVMLADSPYRHEIEADIEPFRSILLGLFLFQSRGTAKVGAIFGPIVLIYFATLAVLGISNIVANPAILWALNPWYALQFIIAMPGAAFLALAVFKLTGVSSGKMVT